MRNEERAALRASATEETEETTVLGLPETEEKEFKFKSIFTGNETGAKRFGIRNIVIVLSVLLIGAAVYVNWSMFGGDKGGDVSGNNGGNSSLVGGNADNGKEKPLFARGKL